MFACLTKALAGLAGLVCLSHSTRKPLSESGEDIQRALFTSKNGSKILLLQIAGQCAASVMTTMQLRSRTLQRKVLCCPGEGCAAGRYYCSILNCGIPSLRMSGMNKMSCCIMNCSFFATHGKRLCHYVTFCAFCSISLLEVMSCPLLGEKARLLGGQHCSATAT